MIKMRAWLVIFAISLLVARPISAQDLTPEIKSVIYSDGFPDAPVFVVEFQSQKDPYSREFYLNVYPYLKEKYIDTGMLYFISMPYPIEDADMYAMIAVQCADDENYWPLMRKMYQERESWRPQLEKDWRLKETANDVDTHISKKRIKEIIAEFGVSAEKHKECRENRALYSALVASRGYANQVFGAFKAGQFFIKDRLYNELSKADFDWLMEKYLKDPK